MILFLCVSDAALLGCAELMHAYANTSPDHNFTQARRGSAGEWGRVDVICTSKNATSCESIARTASVHHHDIIQDMRWNFEESNCWASARRHGAHVLKTEKC